jgi:hypothetical protein
VPFSAAALPTAARAASSSTEGEGIGGLGLGEATEDREVS